MTRTVCRARPLLYVLAVALAGCKGLFGSQGLPHDPMFLDKQPIAAKAKSAPPQALAYAEPTPPVNPSLAGRPLIAAPSRSVPGTLTNRPRSEPQQEERDER
jgi:hypothetical protein